MSTPADTQDASDARPALASIEDVRARVAALVVPRVGVEAVPLERARGRVLARPLASPRALPVFDHSAMDGYALARVDGAASYRLAGRVTAGGAIVERLAPGDCVRIFTGAPIPNGADAVVMQEQVVVADGRVTPRRPVERGDNIRHAGEDVAAGADLAPAGTLVDARHIGLAAAAGLARLDVRPVPRIAILSTGDELVAPGSPLAAGRIFDSNRYMLAAALERPGLGITDLGIVRDDAARLAEVLLGAVAAHDLVVTTGGASVGDQDHLASALASAGGTIEVARTAIRPGKPFTFGRLGGVPIAILPGNPFAALVAALLFVRPMIERAMGLPMSRFEPLPAEAGFTCPRTPLRTEFLPARIVRRGETGLPTVERLGRGGSARLKPLIDADGLAVITPGAGTVAAGDRIGYLPFGSAFEL